MDCVYAFTVTSPTLKFTTWQMAVGHPFTALASAAVLLSVPGAQHEFFRNPTLLYLGKISYGLYVLHEFAHFCGFVWCMLQRLAWFWYSPLWDWLLRSCWQRLRIVGWSPVLAIERALCACAVAASMTPEAKLLRRLSSIAIRELFRVSCWDEIVILSGLGGNKGNALPIITTYNNTGIAMFSFDLEGLLMFFTSFFV